MMEDKPQWGSIGVKGIESLPALQWKLVNIRKMPGQKRTEQVEQLRRVLS